MQTKICSRCKRELPLEAFGKCSKAKDGLKWSCKECRNALKREYNKTHKQQTHDYKQWYRKTHIEELKASGKKYKAEHREEIRIKAKIYNETHKEERKIYYEKNKKRFELRRRIGYMEGKHRYCIPEEKEKVLHYEEAKADNFKGWVRHHRLETHTSDGFLRVVQLSKAELIALDMYYNRPADELIWLKAGVHRTVHGSTKGKENAKRNI